MIVYGSTMVGRELAPADSRDYHFRLTSGEFATFYHAAGASPPPYIGTLLVNGTII